MKVIATQAATATVELSTDELHLVSNALNEIANGVHDLGHDAEFETRLGHSREDTRRLLASVGALLSLIS
jgi:hypothetical protein